MFCRSGYAGPETRRREQVRLPYAQGLQHATTCGYRPRRAIRKATLAVIGSTIYTHKIICDDAGKRSLRRCTR